ncbi:ribonuclease H-like domain-containing protein [Salibacterium halotolerans]|uniref:YprB ribonuclease H-like domain-containing protein n=1 Tax=Salibacterium halotolerans TaxID=1884432 RepID=A0A1I5US06_9BACI|nr:ribonuclease H-like domain-containing protein [Salibacterium halotolerans]SFP98074.1 hypothetical protein SAMN05518683_11434 [Salibacterium halotolerans]
MKLKHKLNRMKHHMSHEPAEKAEEHGQTKQKENPQQEIPFLDKWKEMDAVPLYLDEQYVLRREKQYSLDYRHGRRRLGSIFQIFERWGRELADHPLRPSGRRPQDLLFFDTETTGLNGGAGNMIYLLGGAWFSEERVHVTQYFLPGPESEAALYYHFLTEMEHSIHHLATYNGKAFDWPQVKTRHTFVRHEVPKLPDFGHFDLLHAARRLFKRVLPSCRLSVVEEEVLGIIRENDTPGYLAPMLYFDYLREQNPVLIEGVIEHNEQDVLSLISLYIELSERVLEGGTTPEETYEIGRWFEQVKEWDKAVWCYEKARHTSEEWQAAYDYALALVLKKQQQTAEAFPYLETVLQSGGAYAAESAVELAKYMEHECKDPEKALHYTGAARAVSTVTELRDDLDKREKRLAGKIRPGK